MMMTTMTTTEVKKRGDRKFVSSDVTSFLAARCRAVPRLASGGEEGPKSLLEKCREKFEGRGAGSFPVVWLCVASPY